MTPTPEQVRREPAGRRLDALVAEYVYGLDVALVCPDGVCRYRDPATGHYIDVPAYSTSWAAAGPLLESEVWSTDKLGDRGILSLVVFTDAGIETIDVSYDRTKENDLCRAIAVAVVLAALTRGTP